MEKQELEKLIAEAEKEAKVGRQDEIWGSNLTQAEIFDAGVDEAIYRLRRLIQKL